jgi:hypothetical protein
MVEREGRIGGIGDKNVRPAVSIEIGDKDLTPASRSGHLPRDHLCGAVDVTASGLAKSDDDSVGRGKDNVWNPIAVEVPVGNTTWIGERIPKILQNLLTFDCVWNL